MKTLKYLMMLLLGSLAFAACSDDDVDRPGGISGDGVYFPADFNSTVLIATGQNSVQVPVMRTSGSEQLTVTILSDLLPEIEALFTVEESATFPAGENTAYVNVSFTFSDIEPGKAYPLSLVLASDDNLTAYGLSTIDFDILYDPWTKMEDKALWRDDVLNGMFQNGIHETEVAIYESDITKGIYRLENVYSPTFISAMFGVPAQSLGSNCRNSYITVNATNPDKVWIAFSDMGLVIDPELGWMQLCSPCPENGISGGAIYGTLKKGVITFPVNGLLIYSEIYNGGSLFYANTSGMTRIVLPGGQAIEPIVTVDYQGVLTNAEGDSYALFNTKLNSDAASFKYAVFSGDLTAESEAEALNAAVASVADGSAAGVESVKESGELRYMLESPDEYTAIFVPFSADGKVTGEAAVVPFEFTSGSAVAPEDFTAEITVTDLDESYANIKVTPAAKNLRYLWGVATREMWDKTEDFPAYNIARFKKEAQSYQMTLEEYIEAAELISKGEDGFLFTTLEPETSYVVYAYCVDPTTLVARSAISTKEFTTLEMPALLPEYEKWLGQWSVTSTDSKNGGAVTFDIEVSLQKANRFFSVRNWGGAIAELEASWKEELPTTAVFNDGRFSLLFQEIAQLQGGVLCFFPMASDFSLAIFEEPFLDGRLSGDNSATIAPTKHTIEGQEFTIVGADYFGYLSSGVSLVTKTQNPAVGPFQLTKKAAAAASSLRSNGRTTVDPERERIDKNLEDSPRVVRRRLLARYGSVLLR